MVECRVCRYERFELIASVEVIGGCGSREEFTGVELDVGGECLDLVFSWSSDGWAKCRKDIENGFGLREVLCVCKRYCIGPACSALGFVVKKRSL